MPTPTTINVYDRPTYQTEKVKGWDTVRVFKGSSLVSNPNATDMIFEASQGGNLIQQFLNANSNYKGTNRFDLSKLENFDSFRIKANGLMNTLSVSSPKLVFAFSIFDSSYTELSNVKVNYGNRIGPGNTDIWLDWYLDIEVTFFLVDDNNSYNFIVNGNFSYSQDNDVNRRGDVRLVPFCGQILNFSGTSDIFMDFNVFELNFTNPLYIKQISIDFVE
jgi:hypothetical protein